ncbi:hypothetical protein [Streptomyces sp. NPDC056144]|uniref:hypothetical protein n=1 Tax=unclassified Streptomyces TaxID=2593676 RepID=UPI0035DA2026
MEPPYPRPLPADGDADAADGALHDTAWAAEARAAALCSGLLLGSSLLVDAGVHGLTLTRTVCWIALAALLLVVLLPARVSSAPGRLTVRGLWTTRTVRTDRLTSVRWPYGSGRRLLLRDAEGARAEVDLRVLLANPALWLRLEAEAQAARRRGTLDGTADLARLSRHVHTETARSVLRLSGLA